MSDFLRGRFPLAGTSTAYMDGTSRYHLVSLTRPGIIASVTLTDEQARQFEEAIREAREEAWQEGYDLGVTDERTAAETEYAPNRVNPYRTTHDLDALRRAAQRSARRAVNDALERETTWEET